MGGRGNQPRHSKNKGKEKNRLNEERRAKAKTLDVRAGNEAAPAEGSSYVHQAPVPVKDPSRDGQVDEPARRDQERLQNEGAPFPETSPDSWEVIQRGKEDEPALNSQVSSRDTGLESPPDSRMSGPVECSRTRDRPEVTRQEPGDHSDGHEWIHVEPISNPSRVHHRSTVEPVNVNSNIGKHNDESELSELEAQGWIVD